MSGAAFLGAGAQEAGGANIRGVVARVALRFRSSCLQPHVLPSVMCDLLDQMLASTSLLLLSVLAAELQVPVVDEAAVLEWFSTGKLEAQSEGVRLLRAWWERVHDTHCFVDPAAPSAVYVALPGSCREASAFAAHYRAGATEEQAARQAYDCSAFQTEKREHDQKAAVCSRLAQQ
eukprot:24658-Rhodomonas_salina.1